ncbi:MAG: zf-HC2 domain-containing protein [Lachnospiraceae bacterium]|nr:zf-HC2 domain-containing protein [Lachnospiraceae bacterium]
MHREYKDCEIVFDLLPLYLDGKTNSESNAYVTAHLKSCENCRQTFSFMQKDFGEFSVKQSVSPVKKRGKISRTKLLLICVLGLYIFGLAGFIVWFFCATALPVL